MTVKTWTLSDASARQDSPQRIDDPAIPGFPGAIRRVQYVGGLSDGVESIFVNNGKQTIRVIPTRGMGIDSVLLVGDQELSPLGWESPIGAPVHPKFVDLGEPSGLGWLDGFNELLVRCGLESNGAPEYDEKTGRLKYPLHGRIANKPAHHVELSIDTDKQEIKLIGIVDETRFHFQKLRMTSTLTTKFNSTSFTISDKIENLSATPAEAQMLYHVNFGIPLLDAGSRVVLPAKTVVPRNVRAASHIKSWDSYAAPEPGFEEMVYFFDLHGDDKGQTRTLLKNAHGTRGVSLVFNTKQLPCFSLWKDTAAVEDGYVTGLEPGTNYPNPRSYEGQQGRVIKLPPKGSTTLELTLEIHPDDSAVKSAEEAVKKIAAGREPKIFDQPQPLWCAP
ncbi:MAG TPA: aldose 1-epimerase family protein [Pirellulaceae bacterium]|nr:aldose 1-epimerase family protein [Pirellulaceae bacterium]